MFIAFLSVIGCLIDREALYKSAFCSPIVFPVAVMFQVLGCAILLARPHAALAASLAGNHSSGRMLRRLLATAVLLSIVFACVGLFTGAVGLSGSQFGHVFRTWLEILGVVCALVWVAVSSAETEEGTLETSIMQAVSLSLHCYRW